MNLTRFYKSRQPAFWKAILVFKLVSAFLVLADQLSIRFGLDGSQRIVDDLLGGLIAGLIFYFYERHRLRRLRQQLHIIDLMNHHARNALQPLMFITDEPESRVQMKLVEECVRRIDWALREVLPGISEERFLAEEGGLVRKAGTAMTFRGLGREKFRILATSFRAGRAGHSSANGSIRGGTGTKKQVNEHSVDVIKHRVIGGPLKRQILLSKRTAGAGLRAPSVPFACSGRAKN